MTHTRHRWRFARPAAWPGAVREVCAHDGCPATRVRLADDDRRCGWCLGGRHVECRTCPCCSVLPPQTTAAGAQSRLTVPTR